jgi:hypothetical protein
MLAFEIYLNNQKVCTAGGDGLDTLTSTVGFFKKQAQGQPVTMLTTAGVRLDPARIATWVQRQLQVGDRIEIRLVETTKADEPTTSEICAP